MCTRYTSCSLQREFLLPFNWLQWRVSVCLCSSGLSHMSVASTSNQSAFKCGEKCLRFGCVCGQRANGQKALDETRNRFGFGVRRRRQSSKPDKSVFSMFGQNNIIFTFFVPSNGLRGECASALVGDDKTEMESAPFSVWISSTAMAIVASQEKRQHDDSMPKWVSSKFPRRLEFKLMSHTYTARTHKHTLSLTHYGSVHRCCRLLSYLRHCTRAIKVCSTQI